MTPARDEDPEIWAVYDALLEVSGAVQSIGEAVRDAFDQILDGQHTGRWDFLQLNKTEKTHIGTLVQINIHRYLSLDDGRLLDYKIAGLDVDCKWSMNIGGWEVPNEMYRNDGPKIALLIWGNDYISKWAAGLFRTDEHYLKPLGKQRDSKRRLNAEGLKRILWLERAGELEVNQLLQLAEPVRRRILGSGSGQACVNSLFREIQGRPVHRVSVEAAAMQDDPMKRVRDARNALRSEGLVIFGHYSPHPEMVGTLGLERPKRGEFVSARLALETRPSLGATIALDGKDWRLAEQGEPIQCAPMLPRQGAPSQAPLALHVR